MSIELWVNTESLTPGFPENLDEIQEFIEEELATTAPEAIVLFKGTARATQVWGTDDSEEIIRYQELVETAWQNACSRMQDCLMDTSYGV